MALSFLLEEELGRSVELVTPEALSPHIGPHILKEVEYVEIGEWRDISGRAGSERYRDEQGQRLSEPAWPARPASERDLDNVQKHVEPAMRKLLGKTLQPAVEMLKGDETVVEIGDL
ncbi:hypothetical protein [Salisaeta longa]|nr:hypothetical protein [Salisaeta longa]